MPRREDPTPWRARLHEALRQALHPSQLLGTSITLHCATAVDIAVMLTDMGVSNDQTARGVDMVLNLNE